MDADDDDDEERGRLWPRREVEAEDEAASAGGAAAASARAWMATAAGMVCASDRLPGTVITAHPSAPCTP